MKTNATTTLEVNRKKEEFSVEEPVTEVTNISEESFDEEINTAPHVPTLDKRSKNNKKYKNYSNIYSKKDE